MYFNCFDFLELMLHVLVLSMLSRALRWGQEFPVNKRCVFNFLLFTQRTCYFQRAQSNSKQMFDQDVMFST
jgi:hypothetical protein